MYVGALLLVVSRIFVKLAINSKCARSVSHFPVGLAFSLRVYSRRVTVKSRHDNLDSQRDFESVLKRTSVEVIMRGQVA